jgi:hypothetical protein
MLFGALRLDSEWLRKCPWASGSVRSVSPLAELLRELVSYGLTIRLLNELLPLDRKCCPM